VQEPHLGFPPRLPSRALPSTDGLRTASGRAHRAYLVFDKGCEFSKVPRLPHIPHCAHFDPRTLIFVSPARALAMSKPVEVSSAGIAVDAVTGERYIPASRRPDGSMRREIRIRPGYRPPEDIEVYRNRAAEAWKNRGKGGVPGAEGLKDDSPAKSASASSNKNAKRREAKRRAKAAASQNDGTAESGDGKKATEVDNDSDKSKPDEQQQSAAAEPAVDPEIEKEKKVRNLKKKLRQARELRDKKDKGESLLPEQLEKVIKIQEIIRQLDALGFDANGEKKVPAEGEETKKEEKV